MKKQRLLIGAIGLLAGLFVLRLARPPHPPAGGGENAPASPAPASPAAVGTAPTPPVGHLPQSPPPLPEAAPVVPAIEAAPADLDALHFTLRDYRTRLGGNPIGTNAEITKALLGDNPKQLKLAVPPGSQLNGSGELCDRWGTPYFFHQLSATRMEIRSAGPDHTMWTTDDVQR